MKSLGRRSLLGRRFLLRTSKRGPEMDANPTGPRNQRRPGRCRRCGTAPACGARRSRREKPSRSHRRCGIAAARIAAGSRSGTAAARSNCSSLRRPRSSWKSRRRLLRKRQREYETLLVVPQLPKMDLRRSRAVYAAISRVAELRRGILNANGRLSPAVQNLLTMRARRGRCSAYFARRFTSRTAPRAALVVSAA
ncbi:hypothetical protein ACVIU4_005184 [Bradyrhizobium barranii subsp. barranii]|nr:hypothetical protein [Bradyrhizobium japonicum]MCP1957377.1 hypothetical protein [Bradyrhizobium japonicum]